jgi:hypothetical protein
MNNLEMGQVVNKLGKYLYKHIDGAFRIEFTPNMCDIYITVYYQEVGDPDTFSEMNIDLNVTTYQDKIRVNVIDTGEMERTLGSKTFKKDILEDMNQAMFDIYSFVCKKVEDAYEDYSFVF